MKIYNLLLSKYITHYINNFFELFLPPIISDRKIIAIFFNYLQGKGFNYYDVTKAPETYPRGRRDNDYNSTQKIAVNKLILGKEILDIGCGNGNYIKYLVKKGYRCVGIDPNSNHLSEENLKIYTGFVKDSNFKEKSFDTILSFKTLEHLPEAKCELNYWRTLARKRIIFIVPCQRYRRYGYDGHVNFYPDEFQLRMQLGLSEESIVRKVSGEWLVYEDI